MLGPKAKGQVADIGSYLPNEVLLRFHEGTPATAIKGLIDQVQGRIVTHMGAEMAADAWHPLFLSNRSFLSEPNTLHLRVPEGIGTAGAIATLVTSPFVDYVEPNYLRHLLVDPNDTRLSELWALKNTGQSGGTADADIDAPEAWDIFTGSPDTIVAVIDSGIDYSHPDLQANIWANSDEIPGNGIDDDGNGYVDDYRGWNFVSGNNNPMDDFAWVYHGTHVAGIIGARGNNDRGVVGVCWNVSLMPLKIFNSAGNTDSAKIVQAIDYASANGARISNNSYVGLYYSITEYNAIQRAKSAGQLFVAAAGNYPQFSPKNNDSTPVYPASYDVDNVVAVLATDHNDNMASFSHYGKNSVDIGAPGGTNDPSHPTADILSTSAGNGYQYLCGTSMATPYVAGTAALALGKCPLLTFGQLKSRLLSQTDILPALTNKCVSDGRLNAYKTIHDPAEPDGVPGNLSATPTGWTTIRLTWTDNSTNEIGFDVQRKLSTDPEYAHLQVVNANATITCDGLALAGVTLLYRLRAYNMAGYSGYSNEISAIIPTNAPGAPSGARASWSWYDCAVHIEWTDMSNNELSFFIEKKVDGEVNWQTIGTLDQNNVSFADFDAPGDTFCNYRVKSSNPTGYAYSGMTRLYVPEH
jgi:subtilisin family serine protease